MLCFWLLLLVKYNHLINTVEINYYDDDLTTGRQRGRVCCCSCAITYMISIYKGCVLGQWDCYNILFCFIASKTFLFHWKLIGIYVSLRTEKLLFQKCMNFLTSLCLAIYICMSGKFPIFLSPPVQFMSIVLQHSMEQFVSLLLSHDLDKKQLPSHLKTNKCVKFYSFYFEMHHDWVLQVIPWSFSWSTFLVE